jgi:ADP-heptose:LPS heptosyltransferase
MIHLQKYKPDTLKEIQKIGVIMFGLMGDVLIRTPVVRVLKRHYPNAKIVALVDPIGQAVLQNNPDVDEIIVFDRKKEKNKLKQNLKKIKAILRVRREKFDLLVNLYNAGSSRPMVMFSGAKYKLGFCFKNNRYLYNIENECDKERLKDEQSLYKFMISIVEPFERENYSLKPVFELRQQTNEKMKNYLERFSYPMEKIYTLNLAASKEDKILSFEKYFFLVEYLYNNFGFIPAVVCNPGQEYLQKRFVEEFLQKSKVPFIALKVLLLDEVASVIHLSRFIVTPDTGLMHLAMAIDARIYAIFTYTHPLLVDIGYEKLTAVYETFDEGELFRKQDISFSLLQRKANELQSSFLL